MSKLFEDLQQGLSEAIEYERGKGKAKSTTLVFMPVKKYNNKEIKRIRMCAGMTQAAFASYMGISPKTVEAWELGRTHPTGPAYRLLSILEDGSIENLSFIKQK